MNRKTVFLFLVLVFAAAILASLTLLPEKGSAPLEYSQIREIAARDCNPSDLGFDEHGNIADPGGLSRHTGDLMQRGGYDPTPWLYSHVGNSYVEGTSYCWLVAFSKPGDPAWTVLYEARDGSVRELFAIVH